MATTVFPGGFASGPRSDASRLLPIHVPCPSFLHPAHLASHGGHNMKGRASVMLEELRRARKMSDESRPQSVPDPGPSLVSPAQSALTFWLHADALADSAITLARAAPQRAAALDLIARSMYEGSISLEYVLKNPPVRFEQLWVEGFRGLLLQVDHPWAERLPRDPSRVAEMRARVSAAKERDGVYVKPRKERKRAGHPVPPEDPDMRAELPSMEVRVSALGAPDQYRPVYGLLSGILHWPLVVVQPPGIGARGKSPYALVTCAVFYMRIIEECATLLGVNATPFAQAALRLRNRLGVDQE
jgi:hypothetical protein